MIFESTIFRYNVDLICPIYWANSRLWVWMVCTPRSNIRAMPENPTALTTNPKTNPIKILLISILLDIECTNKLSMESRHVILDASLHSVNHCTASHNRCCEYHQN